jgi:hypothetical protein
MMEWMEHLTQEDVRRIRLVAEALGWQHERVVKTPFSVLIRELAVKVIEERTAKEYNVHVIETIDRFLEDKKK